MSNISWTNKNFGDSVTPSDMNQIKTTVNSKTDASDKDGTGGFPGLTLFKINFKNVLNTFISFFSNSNTASRTYTFPDVAALGAQFTQAWWDTTVYKNSSAQVGGMLTYLTKMDKIRMAAHLTAPGYLRINSTLSTLQSAGAAFFEIDCGAFRGTPTFSILNTDGTTVRKTGNGKQTITDSVWPGGWNFLATEN